MKIQPLVAVVACASLCLLIYFLSRPESTASRTDVDQASAPSAAPSQASKEPSGYSPDPAVWKYDVPSADDLIQSEMVSGMIALTPYANGLGFHIRKNAAGNWTAQKAPGILDGLMHDYDMFHSPSRDCPNSETVGVNLPESIILWNDDGERVAIVTYCVDSANGNVKYNNDASVKLTQIKQP